MKKLLLLILLSFPVTCHAENVLKFFVMEGDNAQSVWVGTATWALGADHLLLSNIGIWSHPTLEQHIGNLETSLLQYSQQYVYNLDFSSGSGVNIDTTTVPGKLKMAQYSGDNGYNAGSIGTEGANRGWRQKYIPQYNTIIASMILNQFYRYQSAGAGESWTYKITDIAGSAVYSYTGIFAGGSSILYPDLCLIAETTYYFEAECNTVGSYFYAVHYSTTKYTQNISTATAEYTTDAGSTWNMMPSSYVYLTLELALSSATYTQSVSTTCEPVFYTWGKFNITKNEDANSTVSATIRLSSNNVNWGDIIPVTNGTILPYTSSYIQTNILLERTSSASDPYVSNAGFSVNFSPPLYTGDVVLASTQTFTGTNTFIGSTVISSLTVTNASVTTLNVSSETISNKLILSKYTRIIGHLKTSISNLTAGADSTIQFDSATVDNTNEFNPGLTYILIKYDGIYRVNFCAYWMQTVDSKVYSSKIMINAAIARTELKHTGLADDISTSVQGLFKLKAGDHITFIANAGNTGADIYGEATGTYTYFSIERIIDNQ
ncbi:MAG: hypothetical protein WC390_09210 [Sulfurimonas sp.]|jgi:hypothetical protein